MRMPSRPAPRFFDLSMFCSDIGVAGLVEVHGV